MNYIRNNDIMQVKLRGREAFAGIFRPVSIKTGAKANPQATIAAGKILFCHVGVL